MSLHLAWRLRRAGWPALIGASLLAAAAAFHLTVLVPERERLTELRAQALSLKERARAQRPLGEGAPEDQWAQLERFLRHFPSVDTAPEWLPKLHAAAEREGLQIASAEYRLGEEPSLKLARYQITLPVKGGYGQIRRFVAAALTDIPALSLDHIGLQRQRVGDTGLEAQIRFTMLMRQE